METYHTLLIEGTLTLRTALHVGSGRSSDLGDAFLRRNAAGEIFIPGSALGGVLRAMATRLAPRLGGGICQALLEEKPGLSQPCHCAVCHLFGNLTPLEGTTEETGGRAARLWVHDATCVQPPSYTHLRDGVGIDRATRAAARAGAVKFDLEVLPAGAVLKLHLELEDYTPEDEALLAAVLAEWQAGRGYLGGRVARGLGAVQFEFTCRRRTYDHESLMDFLRGDGLKDGSTDYVDWLDQSLATAQKSCDQVSAQIETPPTQPDAPPVLPAEYQGVVAGSWLEVKLHLQATGPFLINDPTEAMRLGFDHAPLTEGRVVLPGSSLRGALRAQAERIARTLATHKYPNEADFLKHCPACNPVARRTDDKPVLLESCDALLEHNARSKTDVDAEVSEKELCLACRLFGSAGLGSRLIVEDGKLEDAALTYKAQDFLAIDRFTGGGRDGAKFDALVLWQPRFTARLRLENPRSWELGWLILALRDLAEGLIPIGFGAAKGFGEVHVPDWKMIWGYLAPRDFPGNADLLQAATRGESIFTTLQIKGTVAYPPAEPAVTWLLTNTPAGAAWLAQARTWVRDFTDCIKTLDPTGQLPKRAAGTDTYFGRPGAGAYQLPDLYPILQEARHA